FILEDGQIIGRLVYERMSETPTDEDREWFPDIAGAGDWRDVLKQAWADYRDESFILQYLSPKVMRDMRFFALGDDAKANYIDVNAIHDERGFKRVRETLARMYDLGMHEANIQVVGADLDGDRTLQLRHTVHSGRTLDAKTKKDVLFHVETLWGHKVKLDEEDA
ncbi:MAG: SpoVR family protein, partial [Pseudomonadota bacterium]